MHLSLTGYNLSKFGHYRVGDEIITNKVHALLRASQTGHHPSWHFHADVYGKLDWSRDIDLSLAQVYQMRARQLREKYDYLVVNFSGGSDSWTILNAFHLAGVSADEIFCRWPLAATQGRFSVDPANRHPSNILSEWDLTIQPALAEIKDWFPNVRITIHDWSPQFFQDELTDNDWLDFMPNDYLNPGAIFKAVAQSDIEAHMIESGTKTAVIDGIDKPQLFYQQGRLYCYFLDKLANAHAPEVNGRVVEHFYWTPDMPEITLTQARAIYRAIRCKPELATLIDRSLPYDAGRKNLWNRITRQIIYPDYMERRFFQADKSYTNVRDEVDAWMFADQFRQSRYLGSWNNVYQNITNSIDAKYFDRLGHEITGFCGFVDGVYDLGEIHRESLG